MQGSIVPMVAALSARRRSGGGSSDPGDNNKDGLSTFPRACLYVLGIICFFAVVAYVFFDFGGTQGGDKKEVNSEKITYANESKRWSKHVTATTKDGRKITGFLPNPRDVLSVQSIVIFNSDFTKFEFVPKDGTVIEVSQNPPE